VDWHKQDEGMSMKVFKALFLSIPGLLIGCSLGTAPTTQWVTEGCSIAGYQGLISALNPGANQDAIAASVEYPPIPAGDNAMIISLTEDGLTGALVQFTNGKASEITLMADAQAPCTFKVDTAE
jgi:hypothetical protein